MPHNNTAWWVDHANGTHQLYQADYTPPPLKPGQILIENHYAGINYKDALSVTGKAPISRLPSIIPGQDLSGVVIESSVDTHLPGDAVLSIGHGLGETLNGSCAQHTVVEAAQAFKIPSHWSLLMAAGFGTAGFTAALALEKMDWNDVQSSDLPVLVTGASGGVGLHALLLLNSDQRPVDIISRKPDHTVFDAFDIHNRHAPIASTTKLLNKPRWSAVIDSVGGDQLGELMKHIAPWGHVVSIGMTQSVEYPGQLYPFIVRGVNMLGMNASGCPLELKQTVFQRCFYQLDSKNYTIPIHTIAFEDLPTAAEQLVNGNAPPGRFVLKLGDKI